MAKLADEILSEHIAKPWKEHTYSEAWRNLPEIPKKSEILRQPDRSELVTCQPERWNAYMDEPEYEMNLPQNTIEGPWRSTTDYIGAHYQILREDAVAPLRHAVDQFKRYPYMTEDKEVAIYTHVTFRGIHFSPIGAAFRIEFSNERAGKLIRWEQSKRLIQGSIVALSTHDDKFQSICKVAIIAARPIEGGLDQNPPQVDIFWGDDKDAVFDPSEKYVMIESKSGYFEAHRYMLEGLQKLMTEKFSLADHIVKVKPMVNAPDYVKAHPMIDLSSVVLPQDAPEPTPEERFSDEAFLNIDILRQFPSDIPNSGMDLSQIEALRSMLSQKVAIIQGPPGTGKTFVSVRALRIMLANMQPEDPPIIVSAQTNHALDQLLNHILKFDENILRLGGRSSKENEALLQRTLYELRRTSQKKGILNSYFQVKAANKRLQDRISELRNVMAPISAMDLIGIEIFLARGVVTQSQHDSLSDIDWDGDNAATSGLGSWLPEDQLEHISRTPLINASFELEENDIEQEKLKHVGEESGALRRDEHDKDSLAGIWMPFTRTVVGRNTGIENREIKRLLNTNTNLHRIPAAKRGDVYRYLVMKLDMKMKRELRVLLQIYHQEIEKLRIAKWSSNIKLVKSLGVKLVGCTTTGLSKYRGLMAALKPRVLLIEEAAQTLEGTIIAGMNDSLQQLILVGDHQQLQASCNLRSLETVPYHMNVSMFERLINNAMDYVMLNIQRRMISDIRCLLCIEPNPFYKNLKDHKSVLDRKVNRLPVPGMGGRDVYFFTHNWPEARNADSSSYNQDEAQMIVGHFVYLTLNGVPSEKITILTFYNGQRKAILRELKTHVDLANISYFNVFTIDSYQGEENDVVMISLVRSNNDAGIGFLVNRNRLVVALSRARRGLYIYGNSVTLCRGEATDDVVGRDPLWGPLVDHMADRGWYDIDGGLPIYCNKHQQENRLYEADDWVGFNGGCQRYCGGILKCGHPCTWKCHPFDHSTVPCTKPCFNQLGCGHGCSTTCGALCYCDQCQISAAVVADFEAIDLNPLQRTLFPGSSFAGVATDIRNRHNFQGSFTNGNNRQIPWRQSRGEVSPRVGQFVAFSDKPDRIKAWNNWEARPSYATADTLAASKNAQSSVVFEENFKPITIKEGKRKNTPETPLKRVIKQGQGEAGLKDLFSSSAEIQLLAPGVVQEISSDRLNVLSGLMEQQTADYRASAEVTLTTVQQTNLEKSKSTAETCKDPSATKTSHPNLTSLELKESINLVSTWSVLEPSKSPFSASSPTSKQSQTIENVPASNYLQSTAKPFKNETESDDLLSFDDEPVTTQPTMAEEIVQPPITNQSLHILDQDIDIFEAHLVR